MKTDPLNQSVSADSFQLISEEIQEEFSNDILSLSDVIIIE